MSRLLAGILLATGILVTLVSGLCTLTLATLRVGENEGPERSLLDSLTVDGVVGALSFTGLPLLVGIVLIIVGLVQLRGSRDQ